MKWRRENSAGPALRGFRLQILYTLARLTEPQTALQASLMPEGIEDLAIFDEQEQLREAIQIKGHTAPLTLSELVSRNGTGLLQRSAATAREHPECTIRLLSYGPFGQELEAAWNGSTSARDRVQKKLKGFGLSPSDVTLLFERLTLERLDEEDEQAKVEAFLSTAQGLAGQSSQAADILFQWLYLAAERQQRITTADLIDRLAKVGRYLHAREGYWREWFSVVEPLDSEVGVESQRERLAEQFQQGISVRFEHILAGCDVPRRRWLDRINVGFQQASVVIVHGASGQGKSALAYRWLQDEPPDVWRLEVKLAESRRDALQIAATLSAHAQAIGAPLTVYLDVRPGDAGWTDLVQELARLPQIRVLVTIREEDWRRARLSGAAVVFEEVDLALEETEAREIYGLLDRPDKIGPFLSFDEAWRRFAGVPDERGPLMEFVYLVTRTETLRERLRQQVDAVRDAALDRQSSKAALDVLAVVSFASALGACIEVASLREHSPGLDLGRIVERLEREYLVRSMDEGIRLDGLHPVRSRLLADILCDGITFDPLSLAQRCLELIAGEDIEIFLLHLATRHTDHMPRLVEHLNGWQPSSWAAVGGTLRGLLWWGVRQYVDRLSGLLTDLTNDLGKAWLVTLDLDLADLNPPHGTAIWKGLNFISEQRRARLQVFHDRQPSKALALDPAQDWLRSLDGSPNPPTNSKDWSAIAELSYWVGRWSITAPITDRLRAVELTSVVDELPLRLLADLLRGRSELDSAAMQLWLRDQRERIAARFSQETDTARIEDRDGTVRAHFIVSWGGIVADEGRPNADDAARKDWLHTEAIRRVELMRGLFPDRSGYGCQGYGHHFLPTRHDNTTKSSIPGANLHPDWATSINAFANRLIEWRFRPSDWDEYVSELMSIRQELTLVLQGLRRGLVAHFKSKHKDKMLGARLDSNAWDALREKLGKGIALPRDSVDEWGFVAEGQESNGQHRVGKIERGFALQAYQRYLKEQAALFTSLNNFLNQAMPHLYLCGGDGEVGIEVSRLLIEAKLKEAGDDLARPELVAHNLADATAALPRFQREFRRLFARRLPGKELDAQDRQEQKVFDSVMALFNASLSQPTSRWMEPERRAQAIMWHAIDEVPRHLIRSLASLERDGIHAAIMPKSDHWEDAPALWISLDSDDPIQVLTAPALARPLLGQGLLNANLTDEQSRLLSRRWEQVVLVPLFRGRAREPHAWLVPIYRLTNEHPASECEWLDDIPRAVEVSEWSRTGLRCWQSADMEDARQFLPTIGQFKVLMTHLSEVLDLAQSDGTDLRVLQDYVSRYQAEWSGTVQSLIDGITAMANRLHQVSEGERDQRPFLVEAASLAADHFEDWMPPGLSEDAAPMSVEICRGWIARATAHLESLDAAGAGLMLDALVQTATLEHRDG